MNEIIDASKTIVRRLGRKTVTQYTALKEKWTNDIALLALAARVPKAESVHLEFLWVCKDKRHNPDNIQAAQKFVWDGLTKAKILPNDGWKQNSGTSHRQEIGDKPGVWVTVIPDSDVKRCDLDL